MSVVKNDLGLIDLHIHTTASDGTMTPTEVVAYAKSKNIRAIAITDHDTVDGIAEAMNASMRINLEVVSGIEISVDHKGKEMHMLGYYIDYKSVVLNETLERLQLYRNQRNPRIIKKLQELGMKVTLEEVAAEAGGNVIGRPHFAAVLIKKGYVKEKQEAFDKYLANGKAAYVKKERLSPEEGIKMILAAGGVPVLAHPGLLPEKGYAQLEALVAKLKEFGLKGIEAYYYGHSPESTDFFIELADKFDLLVTGGTDFHGANKPEIELGSGSGDLKVPYFLLRRMKDSLKRPS